MGDFTQQDLNTYKSVLFDEDEQNKLLELDLISKFDNADKSGFNFLLPYVGKNYKKQRILIVAESKYIETTDDDVPAKTFYKWIINRVLNQNDDSEVADFIDKHNYQIYTRQPFVEYYKCLHGERDKTYQGWPFLTLINDFCDQFNCTKEEALLSFAFMNFFIAPVVCSGKDNGMKRGVFYKLYKHDCKEYREYAKRCSDFLDDVIDCLNPDVVFMCSKYAWDNYWGKHQKDGKIVWLYHPSDNRNWSKKVPFYEGKTSKEVFKEKLEELKHNF